MALPSASSARQPGGARRRRARPGDESLPWVCRRRRRWLAAPARLRPRRCERCDRARAEVLDEHVRTATQGAHDSETSVSLRSRTIARLLWPRNFQKWATRPPGPGGRAKRRVAHAGTFDLHDIRAEVSSDRGASDQGRAVDDTKATQQPAWSPAHSRTVTTTGPTVGLRRNEGTQRNDVRNRRCATRRDQPAALVHAEGDPPRLRAKSSSFRVAARCGFRRRGRTDPSMSWLGSGVATGLPGWVRGGDRCAARARRRRRGCLRPRRGRPRGRGLGCRR